MAWRPTALRLTSPAGQVQCASGDPLSFCSGESAPETRPHTPDFKMSPASLVFASFLVPGLGHFLLGKPVRGVIALATCLGLFFAGLMVLGPRLQSMALLDPSSGIFGMLLTAFPVRMLPEAFNWAATGITSFLQSDPSVTIERVMRLPVEGEHLAGFLTGASGFLSVFWAVDVWWLAKQRQAKEKGDPVYTPLANPGLAVGLTWLVPGLGHMRAGQKDKGLLLFVAVVLVFIAGLMFSHGHAVDRPKMPVWWIGQSPFGGGVLFTSLVTSPWMMSAPFPIGRDLGVVLCTTAGLMNLLVMLDAYTVATRPAGLASEDPAAATASSTANETSPPAADQSRAAPEATI